MKQKGTIFQNQTMVSLMAALCCLLWGSAFPGIKLCYQWFQIPAADTAVQILFAGIRFTLAGLLTILAGSLLQKKFLKPTKEAMPKVFRLSLLQTVTQYVLFYVGLAHTTGVKSSIINAINVFFAILVSCVMFRLEKLNSKKIVGCIIGFAGVVIVNLGGTMDMSFQVLGDGCLLLSSFAYAMSTVVIKLYGQKYDPVMLSGYQFTLGGMIMVIAALCVGGRISTITVSGLLLLLYLAMVSAGAYTLWGILLKYQPVSKVAVFGFCTPIFGVLLSALVLKESTSFQPTTFVALVLVCIGIVIVNYQKEVK